MFRMNNIITALISICPSKNRTGTKYQIELDITKYS